VGEEGAEGSGRNSCLIPLTLFILLLCAIALCFACNGDIFSPAKFYHAQLAVFFTDVFFSEQSGYVYAVYLGFILAGMLLSIVEAYTLCRRHVALIRPEPSGMIPARFVIVLWALSAIPVLAQCYLIHITGGLGSLAMTIAHRLIEWRGLGPLIMLIRLIAPINLVYFTVGLVYAKRHAGIWWSLYGLHLLLFTMIATLQGSRGFVLTQVLFMVIIYHYLKRPVKLRYAVVAGVALLVVAAFLGTVRNNLSRLQRIDSVSDLYGDLLSLTIFSYGTNPLNAVFSQEFTDYQYGKTFITPVTNFVPRRIWPDKFESGGVVLTKFLSGHSYSGLTHMSTGVVAEGILNFGYPMGMASGFLLLLAVGAMVTRFYTYFRRHVHTGAGLSRVFLVCVYVYVFRLVGSLLYGEFQSHVGGLLIRLLLLSGLIVILRLRLGFPSLSRGSRDTRRLVRGCMQ
jgi:oligosaccharide repeat unit polymerase